METIAEITGSHTGVGRNGKPYTITKGKTATGKYFSTFDVVEIGDQVELSNYNEQYKNWQAKKPGIKTTAPVEANALKEVNDKLDRILKILETNPEVESQNDMKEQINIQPEDLETEDFTSEIPF